MMLRFVSPNTFSRFFIRQVAIRTAGGIPAIVACIAAHPDSVDVAHNACEAMANLAANADNEVINMCSMYMRIMW